MPVALVNLGSYASARSVAMFFLIAVVISPQLHASASIEQQRKLFREASAALERNQISRFNRLLKKLDEYPAAAYLEYDAFRRNANRIKPSQAEKFFQHYSEYPFVFHARAKWLNVLAKRQDWNNYLSFFDDRENTRLRCLAFKARLELGQLDGLLDEISRVWLRGYSQCDPAFAYFLENHDQVEQMIWLRIEKAFKARRPKLARYLSKQLDQQGRATVETWYQAHLRPERSLKKLADAEDTALNRTIIAHAIDRLARKNSLKALELWNLIRDDFAFDEEQRNQSQLRIALSAAYQHEPEARVLLSGLDPQTMNDQAYLWLARIQLRNRDWPGLLETINQMPAHLQLENEWQYWLSRSMEAEGQLAQSLSLLDQLSDKSSYYGFLAADKLKREYRIEQEDAANTEIDEDEMLAVNPHMLRARELFYLDRLG